MTYNEAIQGVIDRMNDGSLSDRTLHYDLTRAAGDNYFFTDADWWTVTPAVKVPADLSSAGGDPYDTAEALVDSLDEMAKSHAKFG